MTGIVNPAMGRSEWFLLALLSMLWGGSFFFIELAVEELKPFTVVLGRTAPAAAALIAYVYLRGDRIPASPRLWGAFLVMGALNGFFPYTLIVWGQVQIESGLASILTATTPLFSLVLAHFLTREERITVGRAAGLLLGVCGVAVMIGPEALRGLGLRSLGQLAVLGAAFSYGCAGIYGRRFKGLPPPSPRRARLAQRRSWRCRSRSSLNSPGRYVPAPSLGARFLVWRFSAPRPRTLSFSGSSRRRALQTSCWSPF